LELGEEEKEVVMKSASDKERHLESEVCLPLGDGGQNTRKKAAQQRGAPELEKGEGVKDQTPIEKTTKRWGLKSKVDLGRKCAVRYPKPHQTKASEGTQMGARRLEKNRQEGGKL